MVCARESNTSTTGATLTRESSIYFHVHFRPTNGLVTFEIWEGHCTTVEWETATT